MRIFARRSSAHTNAAQKTPPASDQEKLSVKALISAVPPRQLTPHRSKLASMPLVLCIDDDLTIARMVADVCRFAKHETAIETSSIDALSKWIHDRRVKAVITDYLMPKLDGIELLIVFRDMRPDVRRVLITAAPTELEAVRKAEADGTIQMTIAKPPTISDIQLAVSWL